MTTNPTPPVQPGQPVSVARYAWFVLVLLAPVVLLNYMDRQMMAAMKYSLMADVIGLDSEAKWGLLPAAFKWTYAILSPLGGIIADRFSKKHVIMLSLFAWSAVTWATGHAQTFDQLMWTRAIMGVSEAFYMPAALALVADYHNGPTRSRAVGIHHAALYFGIILGGFSGYVADAPNLGWRWAFDAAGIFGVIYAVPLFFLLRNAPRNDDAGALGEHALPDYAKGRAVSPKPPQTARRAVPASAVPASAVTQTFTGLLGNKYFIMLVLYFTLPGLAGWVVKDWMPTILKEQFDISQGHAGVSAALYTNLAGILGLVLGGWLADRRMRRTLRGRIHISALGVVFIIPALFGVGNAGSLTVAVAFLMLFGLGWGFFDCNHMPILCQIARPEWRATGYGIMNFVCISCGGFADWGVGVMRDNNMPNNLIFAVFACLCVFAAAIVLNIKPDPGLKK